MSSLHWFKRAVPGGLWLISALMALSVQAQTLSARQEAQLKSTLTSRVPELAALKAIRATPFKGLYEIEIGSQVLYTDAKGEFLIEGHMLETRTQRNLTQERLDDLNKVDFASFPLKDAVVWKNGTGQRKLVIFSDPHCGYCKRLETELQSIKDVTVYTFLIPILSEDSKTMSERIWCAKDRTQSYRDWMITGTMPPRLLGMCGNSPIARNLQMSQKLRVQGTPAMFFEDGSRLASAAPVAEIEKRLQRASRTLKKPR